jgi:GNAT superfamily N-acetyltransferase
MTREEFERLPRHPGWKCEYWDGQAHLSPRHLSACGRVAVAPRAVMTPCPIRAVSPADAGMLSCAFVEAFADTIDYCDWEVGRTEQAAHDQMRDYFAGTHGEPLSASRVALDQGDGPEVAGAALVIRSPSGQPRLSPLFVVPHRRRAALATALVASVLNTLHELGEATLESRWHVGNDASVAWHRAFGFVEQPDLALAEVYYRCAAHELWRRKQLGGLGREERARLVTEARHRWHELWTLRRLGRERGSGAVLPSRE